MAHVPCCSRHSFPGPTFPSAVPAISRQALWRMRSWTRMRPTRDEAIVTGAQRLPRAEAPRGCNWSRCGDAGAEQLALTWLRKRRAIRRRHGRGRTEAHRSHTERTPRCPCARATAPRRPRRRGVGRRTRPRRPPPEPRRAPLRPGRSLRGGRLRPLLRRLPRLLGLPERLQRGGLCG